MGWAAEGKEWQPESRVRHRGIIGHTWVEAPPSRAVLAEFLYSSGPCAFHMEKNTWILFFYKKNGILLADGPHTQGGGLFGLRFSSNCRWRGSGVGPCIGVLGSKRGAREALKNHPASERVGRGAGVRAAWHGLGLGRGGTRHAEAGRGLASRPAGEPGSQRGGGAAGERSRGRGRGPSSARRGGEWQGWGDPHQALVSLGHFP